MFDDSSTDFSYLEETEHALLELQRQLQPWLLQQTQRHQGDGARSQSSPDREPAKVRRARKLLDRLPRHTRLNQRVTTLGITLEELDDMGLLEGSSIPPYFRSLHRRDRREMDMRRRSARRRARTQERQSHAVVTVNHMLRVLERRGVNVVAHFRAYDQQARGILTRQQFAHALQALGLPLSSNDIGRLIADFAVDEAHKHVSCFSLLVDANILPNSAVGQQAYVDTLPTAQRRQQFDLHTNASEDSGHAQSWASASEVTMLVQEVRSVLREVAHQLRKTVADVYEMFAVSADPEGFMPAAQFFRVLARLHVALSEDQQALLVELFGDEAQKRVQFEDFLRYVFDAEATGTACSQEETEEHTASNGPQSPMSSVSYRAQHAASPGSAARSRHHRRPLSAVSAQQATSSRSHGGLRPLTASARVHQSGWSSEQRVSGRGGISPGHKRVSSGELPDDFIYEEPSDDGFDEFEGLYDRALPAQAEHAHREPRTPSSFQPDELAADSEPERTRQAVAGRPVASSSHIDNIRQRRRSFQAGRSPTRRQPANGQSPAGATTTATMSDSRKPKLRRPHSAGPFGVPRFSLSGTMSGKLSAQTASSYGSFAYIPTLQQPQSPSKAATLHSGITDQEVAEDSTSNSQAPIGAAPAPSSPGSREQAPAEARAGHSSSYASTLHQLRQLIQQRHSPDRPLRWIFRHFDRKKRNYFDKADLVESLRDLKLDCSPGCVDYLMKTIAIDDGEQVSLGEFMVFATDPHHQALADSVFSALAAQLESQGRSFYGALFTTLSAGEGFEQPQPQQLPQQRQPSSAAAASGGRGRRAVSREEFVSGLLSLCKHLTVKDAERMAVRFDLHGSGYVSLGRFWKSLSNSRQWKAAEELLIVNEEALEQAEIVKDRLRLGESLPDVTVEIVDMAVQLGVRLLSERHLLWIVKKALQSELPEDWSATTDSEGRLYYFNRVTGEVSWQHPLRGMFLKLVCQQRKGHVHRQVPEHDEHVEQAEVESEM